MAVSTAQYSFKPFAVSSVAWLFIAGAALLYLYPELGAAGLKGFFAIWTMSVINFYLLGKLVARLPQLMTKTGVQSHQKAAIGVQVMIFGMLKITLFLIILWYLFTNPYNTSLEALAAGAGTWIFVPIVGGLWWSQQQLNGEGK